MVSDIAFCNGSQQGVADSMKEHIGIRMPFQSIEMRDSYSSQDQGAAFDERMDIISETHSHLPLLLFSLQGY